MLSTWHTSTCAPPVVKGIASWPWYYRFMRDPLGSLIQAQQRFGSVFALSPIPFVNGKHKQLIAFDPAINHRVLSDSASFKTCPIAPRATEGSSMSRFRAGFQLSEQDGHQELRRAMLPAFSKKAVRECHGEIVGVTEDCLARWPTGTATNVATLVRELSLAISGRLLFGAEPTDRANMLSHLLEESVRATFFSWAMALPVNIPGTPYWRLTRMCDRLAALLDTMIQERRSRPSGRRDVLETLVRSLPAGVNADLIGPTSFLFVASFETLTSTMTWTLFLLAQHPEIMADLRQPAGNNLPIVGPICY